MKDSKSIISHLVQQPSFKKCEQARCFGQLLALLPASFTQWVKFLYIKNNTLFFVFNHPCAKMEFNYKRNLIKSLLSQISVHMPECSFTHVENIQCFISNKPDEEAQTVSSQHALSYTERSQGLFENNAHDKKLHALFETIRQRILDTQSC